MVDKGSQVVQLARKAIEKYVRDKKRINPPEKLSKVMKGKGGVFVSIKKKGNLRGCIGTTRLTQENVAQEIISNAISACSKDPRFQPVKVEELDDLEISVDVLGEQEPISNKEELDPDKYGVIVKKGNRTGLLLPDLDGVDTINKQVNIAKKKAGIPPTENSVELFRFKVHRYK